MAFMFKREREEGTPRRPADARYRPAELERATTSRVTSGQKRSALPTATEGQGAVLALPLCLEGLVFSRLAAADHPRCRNLSAPG